MANFKVGDWVQITPQPDTRWEYWNKEHTALAGAYGEIADIEEAPDAPGIKFILIVVYDDSDSPAAQEWFLERHIIMATRYDKIMNEKFMKACDELQVWEKKKKEILDESLRITFGISKKKKNIKNTKKTMTSAMKPPPSDVLEDIWDESTDELSRDDIDKALDALDSFDFDGLWSEPPDGAD